MKKLATFVFALGIITSCHKPNPVIPPAETHPRMAYIDLADSSITFGHAASFDLDKNGRKDILFSTQLVGDPVNQLDKKQWLITSSFDTNLPVDDGDSLAGMNYGEDIPVNNFPGYYWCNASSLVLAQKIISNTVPPYWEGQWKNASHRYAPFQVIINNELFNGWIEISFSSVAEKIILHRAAVSVESNKAILAGK